MTMAANVRNYLDRSGIHYSVDRHTHTYSSMRTAEAAHVPSDQLAKRVLLKDHSGYLLAVVPATQQVRIGLLHDLLGRDLDTATENELPDIFSDCEKGAVPPLGPAYDLDTVVDPTLCGLPDVYFESGDHEELVHLAGEDFEEIMDDARFVSCGVYPT